MVKDYPTLLYKLERFLKSSLLSFVFFISLIDLSQAQVYIWGGPNDVNSEFANGLNDWTTSSIDSTKWVWDENAKPNEGSYGQQSGPLISESAFNGVALFNSDKFNSIDWIDYPHRGELTSPTFSTEGHSSVFVKFHQDIRFWDPKNISILQVSSDGGNTWLPQEGIEINPEIKRSYNRRVDTANMVQLVDISEYAVNRPIVQFRFVWEGAYYYWMIDDVYVIERPDVELTISSVIYDPIAVQVPFSQCDARGSQLGFDIINRGKNIYEGATVGVQVKNVYDEVIYEDSLSKIDVLAGESKNILFENAFIPDLESYSGTGSCSINYWLRSPGLEEINPYDNYSKSKFYLTEGYYDSSVEVYSYHTYPKGSYGAFSIFQTGTLGEENSLKFAVDSVGMQVFDDNGEDNFLADIMVFMYKVSDEVAQDFSNWDTQKMAPMHPDEVHPQMTMVGFGFETSYQGEDKKPFKVGLYDIDFTENILLEPNSRYMLMAYWNNEDSIYHGVDEDVFYNGTPTCGWYYGNGDSNGSYWNFEPGYGWKLSLDQNYVICIHNTKQTVLPTKTLMIRPNPVNEWLYYEIALDADMKGAKMYLYDTNKHVMKSIDLDQQSDQKGRINVRDLPSGPYFLNLISNEGVATQRVLIQR